MFDALHYLNLSYRESVPLVFLKRPHFVFSFSIVFSKPICYICLGSSSIRLVASGPSLWRLLSRHSWAQMFCLCTNWWLTLCFPRGIMVVHGPWLPHCRGREPISQLWRLKRPHLCLWCRGSHRCSLFKFLIQSVMNLTRNCRWMSGNFAALSDCHKHTIQNAVMSTLYSDFVLNIVWWSCLSGLHLRRSWHQLPFVVIWLTIIRLHLLLKSVCDFSPARAAVCKVVNNEAWHVKCSGRTFLWLLQYDPTRWIMSGCSSSMKIPLRKHL